jgi:hypothetical protein
MTRRAWLVAAALGPLLWTAGEARAQPQVPGYNPFRPTVSPYINLLRNNNNNSFAFNQGINYFGIVRPEFNIQNSLLQLDQQVTANQQAIALGDNTPLQATGHPVNFLNHRRYFMTMRQNVLPALPGVQGLPGTGVGGGQLPGGGGGQAAPARR